MRYSSSGHCDANSGIAHAKQLGQGDLFAFAMGISPPDAYGQRRSSAYTCGRSDSPPPAHLKEEDEGQGEDEDFVFTEDSVDLAVPGRFAAN